MLAAAIFASLCVPNSGADAPVPVYDGQVRDEGDGLMTAYMVPAGADNHAATIEQLPDGSLVGAWFAGDHEQASGLGIAVARLMKGTTQWTNSTIVTSKDGYADQNPLLFYDNTTGKLHLFHTQAPHDSGESEAEIYHLSSEDEGATWSESKKYFDMKGAFTRNRIIRRKDQTLLWPYYSTASSENGKCPAFAISNSKSVPDSGDGWKTQVMDQGDARLEQPTCWRQPHDDKTILCYFRDCNQKNIYAAESTDEGESWSEPKKIELENPGSGIEGFPLKNGDLILLYNPTTKDARDPLAAGVSSDGGKHWTSRNVQKGPTGATSTQLGEFAYPTVLQTPEDGMIHVMYTYGPGVSGQKKTIKYIRFQEEWVTNPVPPAPTPPSTPTPSPTPPAPTPPTPAPTPSTCDVGGCIARCVSKYGKLSSSGPTEMCAKGCAAVSGGHIDDKQKYCNVAPADRENYCDSECKKASGKQEGQDECKYGCEFWKTR